MKKYGIIYKITNKVNNKVYIGQTKKSFDMRYCYTGTGIERVYNFHKAKQKNNKKCNSHLIYAIEKYGIENFKIDKEFDIAYSKSELDNKEIYWIKYYNSFENGYNNNLGGQGNSGHYGIKNSFYGKHHSEETKKRLREININKHHSYKTRIKMSEKQKTRFKNLEERKKLSDKGKEWWDDETKRKERSQKMSGRNNPMYNKDWRDGKTVEELSNIKIKQKIKTKEALSRPEVKKKLSKANSGANNPSSRKVICITTRKIFNTMKEASEYYNCSYTGICNCCKGKVKSSGKFNDKKLIWEYYKDN
ncbi:GIY-YIG nuclease family protein [Clostridium perfringens]|uniref:GIY-YIG nuclease family protein n=1 Tax=Clostridium perfringens TaxID=1502 RepID=UPI002A3260F5|nr:GIY-YIG nuclease family protein [Clostridium perfringens]MDK0754326.1 GIY-YIG nuclease family protein [Clostridium perfringens]MDK0757500.1 GIY-YIG nuclease family protein [Clostridium perfringens]